MSQLSSWRSLKPTARWWFSNTDSSLYIRASSESKGSTIQHIWVKNAHGNCITQSASPCYLLNVLPKIRYFYRQNLLLLYYNHSVLDLCFSLSFFFFIIHKFVCLLNRISTHWCWWEIGWTLLDGPHRGWQRQIKQLESPDPWKQPVREKVKKDNNHLNYCFEFPLNYCVLCSGAGISESLCRWS